MENVRENGDSSADTPQAKQTSGLTIESSPRRAPRPVHTPDPERVQRSKAATLKRERALATFLASPRESQRKQVEDKWALLCYQLVEKAQGYAANVTDKDFGRLSQLITAAAISKDKVFHREDIQQKQGNVVFQLFGNVGLDAIKRMLQPPTPKVVNKEITNEVNSST